MLSPARRYTVDSSPMAATRAVSHRLADMRSASRQHSKENEMDNGICWEPEIIEKHTRRQIASASFSQPVLTVVPTYPERKALINTVGDISNATELNPNEGSFIFRGRQIFYTAYWDSVTERFYFATGAKWTIEDTDRWIASLDIEFVDAT